MQVGRKFSFGSTPFVHNFRAYIPRLYPRDEFTEVVHPNASGSALVTELAAPDCEFGCAITDWDRTWLAIHAPATGRGLIVDHEASSTPVALWGRRGRRLRDDGFVSAAAPSTGRVHRNPQRGRVTLLLRLDDVDAELGLA